VTYNAGIGVWETSTVTERLSLAHNIAEVINQSEILNHPGVAIMG
jgi:hypothetical protein